MKGLKNTVMLLLFAVLVLASGCQGRDARQSEAEAAEAAESQETVFAVNVTRSVEGQIFDYLEVNGDIVAESSVDVFADTSGKLLRLNVGIGDYVRKEQVIAQVDPSRPGQTFAASPVKSPISGTVTSIPGEVGATISPAVPVATVSKVDSLEISTGVSERYIAKVRRGQKALVELEAYPDLRFEAFVSEISPVVDPVTRSMAVTLAFREQDKRIKAGMFAKVRIIVEDKERIVKIPSECLINRYGVPYVFVVSEDGRAEAREVVPGIQIDDKLEVVRGLAPGETVVIRGQTLLEDQAKVRIIDEVPALEASDTIR
jgi:membrane fusion protein, multidrug efflux system